MYSVLTGWHTCPYSWGRDVSFVRKRKHCGLRFTITPEAIATGVDKVFINTYLLRTLAQFSSTCYAFYTRI